MITRIPNLANARLGISFIWLDKAIFSTHLHDLAASIDAINGKCAPLGGVSIDSLVAEVKDGSRSFKIQRKKPDGKSYARDIALKYGISYENIINGFNERK